MGKQEIANGEYRQRSKQREPAIRKIKERQRMNKRRIKILILGAASSFVLSGYLAGTALAGEEDVAEDYVVCTVNGAELYDSDFTKTYRYYEEVFQAAGYDTEGQETASYLEERAWDATVSGELMRQGLEKDGYYDFSEEEEKGFESQDERDSQAFSDFQDDLKEQISFDDEEIREYYDELVAADQETYQDNISAYEYTKYYTGTDLWYIPEGYRQVLQIVLDKDDEELDEKTEEIYRRAEEGEAFRELVKEYTIDETATEEKVLEQGYYIHQDSVVWSQEMIEAAFSQEMQEPGDLTSFTDDTGTHILYYAGNLESGPAVEYTDETAEYVLERMEEEKLQELSDEYLDGMYDSAVILQTADPSYGDSGNGETDDNTAGEDSE